MTGPDLACDPVQKLRSYAEQFKVQKLCSAVLDDPRFPLWSGSSRPNQHHYGKGGLAQHTLEVVDLCLLNRGYFPDKNIISMAVFVAALFHDSGKMWDYEPVPDSDYKEWRGTEHKKEIHHITRSVLVFHEALCNCAREQAGYDVMFRQTTLEEEIIHAILAHHMLRDWGSPVEPKTEMAWLLTLCDNMSARMYDCRTLHRR